MIDRISEFIERNFWEYFWGSLFFIILTAAVLFTWGMAKVFFYISGAAVVSTLLIVGIVKLVEFGRDYLEALKVRKWAEQKQKQEQENLDRVSRICLGDELEEDDINGRIERYWQRHKEK